MKTRTAVLYQPGEAIRVEEVELDPPKDHEVQVKMVAAGVCHSDYHLVTGELPGYMPMALGHEGAGIVEEVGSAVTNCKPGDHVVLSFQSISRMNSNHSENIRVLFRKLDSSSAAFDRCPDGYDSCYVCFTCAMQHIIEVVCEIGVIKMRVGFD